MYRITLSGWLELLPIVLDMLRIRNKTAPFFSNKQFNLWSPWNSPTPLNYNELNYNIASTSFYNVNNNTDIAQSLSNPKPMSVNTTYAIEPATSLTSVHARR